MCESLRLAAQRRSVRVNSDVMPHRDTCAGGMRSFVLLFGLLGLLPAHARGVCYGDCTGNGIALLIFGPLVFIYLKFWNKRKGGPTFAQCLCYVLVSVVIALGLGWGALALAAPLWLAWTIMACALLASFTVLIHPRRHALRH